MQVTIIPTLVDKASWTKHDVQDLCAFLATQWPVFPDTARIYHKEVSKDNDVTPGDEAGIERLAQLQGPFFVVIYPEGPGVLIVAAIVFAVAAVAFMPAAPPTVAIPTTAQRNQNTPSPNNELSERTNRPRPNGRIPDIFGQVRSTPDLIATPYKVFESGREVEYAYMCIGRGYYEITDVRDGTTLAENIPGTSVAVYEPFASPNGTADEPQLEIGAAIGSRVFSVARSNGVNGQVLRPPNQAEVVGSGNIIFQFPNVIRYVSLQGATPFASQFAEGDAVTISSAVQGSVSVIPGPQYLHLVGSGGSPGAANNFGASFDTGGYVWFALPQYVPQVAPAGWVVGNTVSVVQNEDTRPAYNDYHVMASSDPDGEVLGALANMEGDFEIAEISIYDGGFGFHYLGALLVDPGSVNSNWDLYTGLVLPMGGDYGSTAAGMTVTLEATVPAFDLDGTYEIIAVTEDTILLDDPASINVDWDILETIDPDGSSPPLSPILTVDGDRWIGPFVLSDVSANAIFCNFIAANGLYKDNGVDQVAASVEIFVEVTPVNGLDVPVGTPETFVAVLIGSPTLKETIAVTLKASFTAFYGRCQVRAKRNTEADTITEGTIVDEVRWRDVYSVAPVAEEEFGNVTTVHCKTFATASALAVKERKLNMLVTRKLPERIGATSEFTATFVATKRADAIISAICRDVYLGNRSAGELDVANIYDTVEDAADYFGHTNAAEFCYTFDNDNLSFEEMIAIVGQAINCVAYRRGSVIRLSFEKETDNSTLLFNHRNKLPGSELREFVFGYSDENDGIEFTYINPQDDSVITIFLPEDYPSVNPKKVESLGVRNHLQGYFLAWRLWNKIRYQNLAIQFEATQEADLLIRNDRILVSDSTRFGSQDGEVIAVDGLELTLSQKVDLTEFDDYIIFLQHYDGTVEAIECTAGTDANQVVLADAPALSLVVDPEGYARATFLLIGDEETQQTAFLVAEKDPQTKMTSVVHAVNYDARYYANDKDYILEIIDENAYGPGGGFTPNPVDPYPPGVVALSNHEIVYTSDFSGSGSYTASLTIFMQDTGSLLLIGSPGNDAGTVDNVALVIDGVPVTVPGGISSSGELTVAGEWLESGPLDLSKWEVMVHQVSGDAPTNVNGATIETWSTFTTNIGVSWEVSAGGGTKDAVIQISIRDAETDVVKTTGEFEISVTSYLPPSADTIAVGVDADTSWFYRIAGSATWVDLAIVPPPIKAESIIWAEGLGLWVAVGTIGTDGAVVTSADGITWNTPVNLASLSLGTCVGVTWSPSRAELLLIANLGTGAQRAATSPDGVTWTVRTLAANQSGTWVRWVAALGLYITGAAGTTQRIQTSPNGVTWTLRTTTTGNAPISGDYNGTRIVVIPGSSNSVGRTSTNGTTWTDTSSISSPNVGLFGIAYGNGVWVAVSYNSIDGNTRFYNSATGNTSWSLVQTIAGTSSGINPFDAYALHFDVDRQVFVYVDVNSVWESPDGDNFTQIHISSTNTYRAIGVKSWPEFP